jgi:hypothetical protein
MGAAGRAKVDAEFTWRRVAAKQMALYEQILGGKVAAASHPQRVS